MSAGPGGAPGARQAWARGKGTFLLLGRVEWGVPRNTKEAWLLARRERPWRFLLG
jgi:hypothetical protein